MVPEFTDLPWLAERAKKNNKELIYKLKKKKPVDLDKIVHHLHYEAFQNIDCLDCANCCSTISPTLYDKDIERLAKDLKLKAVEFVQKYLMIDEEKDYVFTKSPCPFLLSDNKCQVYQQRPKACREYPHTDRQRFYQILDITLRNTYICPVAYKVVEELKKSYL